MFFRPPSKSNPIWFNNASTTVFVPLIILHQPFIMPASIEIIHASIPTQSAFAFNLLLYQLVGQRLTDGVPIALVLLIVDHTIIWIHTVFVIVLHLITAIQRLSTRITIDHLEKHQQESPIKEMPPPTCVSSSSHFCTTHPSFSTHTDALHSSKSVYSSSSQQSYSLAQATLDDIHFIVLLDTDSYHVVKTEAISAVNRG